MIQVIIQTSLVWVWNIYKETCTIRVYVPSTEGCKRGKKKWKLKLSVTKFDKEPLYKASKNHQTMIETGESMAVYTGKQI